MMGARKEYEVGKRYRFGVRDKFTYEATFDGMQEGDLCRWKDVVLLSSLTTTPPSLAKEAEKPYKAKIRIFRHQDVILDFTPEELLALYEKAKSMKDAKAKGTLGKWHGDEGDNVSIIMKLDDHDYDEHTLGLKIRQIEDEDPGGSSNWVRILRRFVRLP